MIGERIVLDDVAVGARVVYLPGWLDRPVADTLFADLMARAPWEQEAPVMFGRTIVVRRRSCSFGDRGTTYRYSGLERRAVPWTEALVAVVERLDRERGTRFNYALANLYPDGEAGLGWHADDESDLVRDAPIASLSLGETRDFLLRRKKQRAGLTAVALEHGSLLVMEGSTQRFYRHALPPRKRATGARVNLTFRCITARASP